MKLDTLQCQYEMYKSLNWIPPRFLGIKSFGEMPPVVWVDGEEYYLKDRYCETAHYSKKEEE